MKNYIKTKGIKKMSTDVKEVDVRKNDIEEKTDCFAYKSKTYCNALSTKCCKFCAFYKPVKRKENVLTNKKA